MTIQTTDDNMTQGEILVMARQVGYTPFEALKWEQALTDFAKLVASAATDKAAEREREACAKYVEGLTIGSTPLTVVMGAIGDAIRARGTHE